MGLEKLGFGDKKVRYELLNRLGLPQSVLVFIFIDRRSRTPFQVGLHKDYKNKTKPNWTRTDPTNRPLSLPDLVVNNPMCSYWRFAAWQGSFTWRTDGSVQPWRLSALLHTVEATLDGELPNWIDRCSDLATAAWRRGTVGRRTTLALIQYVVQLSNESTW